MLNAQPRRRPLAAATRLAVLLTMISIAVPVALAQGRLATLTGSVLDPTDNPVANIAVALSNDATQAKREARTNAAGQFVFAELPPGEYRLTIEKPGFKAYKETVAVTGQDVVRDARLQVGDVRESITVKGGSPAPGQAPHRPVTEAARQRAEQVRQQARGKCDAAASTVGGHIVPPLKLIHVHPEYPTSLVASKVAGTVILDTTLAMDGFVKAITVVSSPHPELGSAATEAVRQWEFSPALLNCRPVDLSMRVTIDFVAP